MLLQRKEKLPEGGEWLYEIKLDGYRALAAAALEVAGSDDSLESVDQNVA
jgi:hypothetical protein